MFNVQSSKFLKGAIAAIAFASQAAFAAPVTFSGALTASDPVFNRPLTTTTLSGVGTATAYDVYGFHVSAAGTYSVESTAFSGTNADTFLAVYRNVFNPASPLTNLLAVDDDNGVGNLSLVTGALQAGVQYYLIFTTFSNATFGTYTGVFNTVTGTGQVSLDGATVPGQVPEPGTLALLGLAALGLGVARRRA